MCAGFAYLPKEILHQGITMDIYEFAMQMEKDGENYYRELMATCGTVGLQRIFAMLADDEVRHYHAIEQMRGRIGAVQLGKTVILENVKNIFVEMKEEKPDLYIDSTAETIAYRKACDIEEDSRKFYLENAEKVEDGPAKMLFLKLAGEEEKHLRIMRAITEFVSRPEPGNWLENAEWHHLQEY